MTRPWAGKKVSVLGGNLLKRFQIILDLKQQQVFLKPNTHVDDPFSASGKPS